MAVVVCAGGVGVLLPLVVLVVLVLVAVSVLRFALTASSRIDLIER